MRPEKEKWILLLILTLIWGSSFILIKKSLEHFNPFEVGALRCLITGILLLPVAILNIKKFPKKHLKWLIIASFAGSFIPMFLFPIAETKVSSSIAGIINSMMPIFVIIIGAIFWKFETSKRQMAGVAICFSGACVLTFGSGENGGFKIIPILLLLLATVFYAISTTTVKSKLNDVPAKILTAFMFSFVLLAPSIIALVFAGFFRNLSFNHSTLVGLGFVSLLSVFGTGLAMMINYRIINISNPLFASTVTLLMPIVAVMWGILDGEKLTTFQFVGGLIIISGLIFLRAKKAKTELKEN